MQAEADKYLWDALTATVDDTLVWGAIDMHLDPLVVCLKALLKA